MFQMAAHLHLLRDTQEAKKRIYSYNQDKNGTIKDAIDKISNILEVRKMKKLILALVVIVVVLGCFAVVAMAQEPLTIMTFNNLSAQFGAHFGLGPTLMPFDEKRVLQVTFLQEYNPDIVGLQEADPHYAQVDYLLGHLSDYSATLTEGELAILYKHDILELKESVYVPSCL